MTLPSISPPAATLLQPEPLTPAAFAPFGTVITSPLSPTLTAYPPNIPSPLYAQHQPQAVPANQSTALKSSPISPLTNNYPAADNTSDSAQAKLAAGLMSIFSSFPRQNTYVSRDPTSGGPKLKLKVGILERHPYTTQTFCPFNYSLPNQFTPSTSQDERCYMLVIVAPTTHNLSSSPRNPPDVTRIRAFLAPLCDPTSNTPTMAVTYAPGTWHAPMIVLGSRRVDFLVTQFANGVANDDCQEVLIGSGPDKAVLLDIEREGRAGFEGRGQEVEIDVSFLLNGNESPAGPEGKGSTDEAVRRTGGASRKAKL